MTPSSNAPRGPFALDLRALAAFRIALGLLVLADLALRATDYAAHYGDTGVLPRDLLGRFIADGQFCLHRWVGPAGQLALWIAAAGAGLCLTAGYRTRAATAVTWVLLLSLQTRNYMVLQAGDVALRLLLFWAIFLPAGARWSADARLRDRRHPVDAVRTVGTMALVIQVVVIYAVAAASKLSYPVWWRDGLGVYYALSTEQFTTGLGLWLVDHELLVRIANYATIAIQAAVPLALLTPWNNERARAIAAAIVIPMHLAFMLALSIGLFSYILVAAWLALLPGRFWDRVERLAPRLPVRGPRAGWLARLVRRERDRLRARPHPVDAICASRWARGLVGALVVYGVWWNTSTNPVFAMPEAAELPGRFLRFEQTWHMFSNPPRGSSWFVTSGTTRRGDQIDPRTGAAPDFAEPPLISATFPGQRWRKYMTNLEADRYRRHRFLLLDYLCRTWNRGDHPRMVEIALYQLRKPTPPPGGRPQPADKRRLARHRCPNAP